MKYLRWMSVLVLVGSIALVSRLSAAPATDSPADVTKALYHTALKRMGFTPETIKAERPWLTPDLYSKLWKKVNQPVPKGDAPDIEADVFLNCQDTPDGVKVGQSSIDGDKAKVDVVVSFGSDKRQYTVLLTQVDGAWKVYEVNYGKDGTLTDLLK